MKFCSSCGKENNDQAIFCSGCGQKFPDGSFAPSTIQQHQPSIVGQTNQPMGTVFTTERGPGAHQHVLTDVFLKDVNGKVLLVARKQSLLHENFNIVDVQEQVVGYITSKQHLTHVSLNVENDTHNVQQIIQVKSMHQRGRPPDCWVEDPCGNKQYSIEYTGGMFKIFDFSCVDMNGSKIFDASINNQGGGIMSDMSALSHRSYSINLINSNFSPTMLLSIIVAVLGPG
jgi:hypothetical protein